ncbi:MAG: pentapeptide repeat-containing protein [Polyangiaceae bacterium]
MLNLPKRPPERVPLLTAPGLSGMAFHTKLPAALLRDALPRREACAADRVGLVDCQVLVLKQTLQFDPSNTRGAVPRSEADGLMGERFVDDDPEAELLYAGDFAPYKALVDVTLSGAREGKLSAASLQLGTLKAEVLESRDVAPLHPFKSSRSALLGTYDDAWVTRRWPYFPEDFDYKFFNAAPVPLRMERLRGDESLVLRGVHPSRPQLETRLPGVSVRAFAQYARAEGLRFAELALRLDTLHIDLEQNQLQLVWRGHLPSTCDRAPELAAFYACVDQLNAPMSLKSARERFAQALEEQELDTEAQAAAIAGLPRRLGLVSAEEQTRRDAFKQALREQIAVAPTSARPEPPEAPALSRAEVEALIASGESLVDADLTACDLSWLNLEGRDLTGALLTAADLSGCNLKGAKLSGAMLTQARLVGADLVGAELTEASLGRCELRQALLTGATLRDADLSRAVCSGSNFQGADLNGADLSKAILDDCNLSFCDLSSADLTLASAANANFREATLAHAVAYSMVATDATFELAKLPGLRADEADFSRASLLEAHAPGASFQEATLREACFDQAALDDASFAHATLHGARFRRCRARTANFRHAALFAADLRGGDFMQSSFERADLRRADLRASSLFEAETLDAELEGVLLDQALTVGSLLSHPLLAPKERQS